MLQFIEESMPVESATSYGLHPNAELGFQRRQADNLGLALQSLRPQRAAQEKIISNEEQAKLTLDGILEKLPETPRLDEIRARLDEPTPFTMVALQVRELTLNPKNIYGTLLVKRLTCPKGLVHMSNTNSCPHGMCVRFL